MTSTVATLRAGILPDGADPRWGVPADAALVRVMEMVEDEYVTGETVDRRADGSFVRQFPTVEELAEKYALDVAVIQSARQFGRWDRHRDRFVEVAAEERTSMRVRVKEVTAARAIAIIDRWIVQFSTQLEAGNVKVNSVGDFNTLLRLRAFLNGGADSRAEVGLKVSLEELQKRHREVQARLQNQELQASAPKGAFGRGNGSIQTLPGEIVRRQVGGAQEEVAEVAVGDSLPERDTAEVLEDSLDAAGRDAPADLGQEQRSVSVRAEVLRRPIPVVARTTKGTEVREEQLDLADYGVQDVSVAFRQVDARADLVEVGVDDVFDV